MNIIRRFLGTFFVLIAATAILIISIFTSAAPKYAFDGPIVLAAVDVPEKIVYVLPYPGSILPDHPVWPIKALRDKVWMMLKTPGIGKIEMNILFADKRLAASKILFERQKPELGYSSLTKAEKYLEEAIREEKLVTQKGHNTDSILQTLATASLKHVEVINEILLLAPEDAKPQIIKTSEYAKNVYRDAKQTLSERGIAAYKNPFDWE